MQALNSSGGREISRTLAVSRNTALSELRKKAAEVNPHFTDFLSSQQPDEELKIEIMAEADEFWICVGKKRIIGGDGMLAKEKAA